MGSASCAGLDNTMDEDCDGIADAMDPCPAEADNTDSDHDMVGDACDPSSIPDQILMFDGFPGTTINSAWSTPNGQWGVHDGVLDNHDTDATIVRAVPMTRMLVETYVDVIDAHTSPTIDLDVDDQTGTAYRCIVVPQAGGGVLAQIFAPGASMTSPALVGTGRVRIVLVEDDANSQVECRVSYADAGQVMVFAALAPGTPILGAKVRLATSAVHATFGSVTIAGIP